MGYLIKQNSTDRPLVFFMADSADHITGKTGLAPTVTLSKNGEAFAAATGAVTEVGGAGNGKGWYKVAGNATDSDTLGALVLNATGGAGADVCDDRYEVYTAIDANTIQWDSVGVSSTDFNGVPVEGIVESNVVMWNSETVSTNVDGMPKVDLMYVNGTIVSGTVSQIDANVTQWNGVGVDTTEFNGVPVDGMVDANVMMWYDDSVLPTASPGLPSVNAVTGTITQVTGSVGSVAGNVTGSVGSVAGNVTGSVGSVAGNVVGSVGSVAADGITSGSIAASAANEIADALLLRDFTAVNDLGMAQRTALNALRKLTNKVAIAAGTLTVYEEDDIASAFTQTVTTDAAANPIISVDTV